MARKPAFNRKKQGSPKHDPHTFSDPAAAILQELGEGLASINRGVILASKSGKVRWMNRVATKWLAEFFCQNLNASDHLPREVRQWLRNADRRGHPRQATFWPIHPGAADKSCVVNYCGRSGSGQFVIVMVRERNYVDTLAAQQFGLTARETEVLFWLSEAKTNQEIATILKTSRRTVDKHVQRILAKLHVENRSGAQAIARDLRRF